MILQSHSGLNYNQLFLPYEYAISWKLKTTNYYVNSKIKLKTGYYQSSIPFRNASFF